MLPSIEIQCPYCGESIEILVDVDDSGGEQQYIEDCQVCCSPINITISFNQDGLPLVSASGENDA